MKKERNLKWIHLMLLAISLPLITVMLLAVLSYFLNFLIITEGILWLISFLVFIFVMYAIFKVPKDQEWYINPLLFLILLGAPLLLGIFYVFSKMFLSMLSDSLWWYSILNLLGISLLLGILISLIHAGIKSKKLIYFLIYIPLLMIISVAVFMGISAIFSFITSLVSGSCPSL